MKLIITKKNNLITLIKLIGEAISLANKVIVLSKRPATIKNIYNIELENRSKPTQNRHDKKYNYYYDLIWNDLDE